MTIAVTFKTDLEILKCINTQIVSYSCILNWNNEKTKWWTLLRRSNLVIIKIIKPTCLHCVVILRSKFTNIDLFAPCTPGKKNLFRSLFL